MITTLHHTSSKADAPAAALAECRGWVHDGGMDRSGETHDATEAAIEPTLPTITWETQAAATANPFRRNGRCAADVTRSSSVDEHDIEARLRERAAAPGMRRIAHRLCAALSRPTFRQVHGRSPMETTCIVRATVADAADVLGRLMEVEWGRGRGAGRLSIEPFHGSPAELGRPWVANAVLEAHGIRRLRVTVAIYRYGNDRCGIQVRPGIRRPRSSRRLRRCLRSTHGAADRLRELVLAVDFTPPAQVPAIAGIPSRSAAR